LEGGAQFSPELLAFPSKLEKQAKNRIHFPFLWHKSDKSSLVQIYSLQLQNDYEAVNTGNRALL
jgi:hypothetical protein